VLESVIPATWQKVSRPAQAKSFGDPISTNGWVQWYMPVIPATQGSTIGRILSRLARAKPYLKNNQHKKGWQSGSRGSAYPASTSPVFNSQYQQKRKEKNRK
jgi:hypothetical protein